MGRKKKTANHPEFNPSCSEFNEQLWTIHYKFIDKISKKSILAHYSQGEKHPNYSIGMASFNLATLDYLVFEKTGLIDNVSPLTSLGAIDYIQHNFKPYGYSKPEEDTHYIATFFACFGTYFLKHNIKVCSNLMSVGFGRSSNRDPLEYSQFSPKSSIFGELVLQLRTVLKKPKHEISPDFILPKKSIIRARGLVCQQLSYDLQSKNLLLKTVLGDIYYCLGLEECWTFLDFVSNNL